MPSPISRADHAAIAAALLATDTPVAEIARTHGMTRSGIYAIRDRLAERGHAIPARRKSPGREPVPFVKRRSDGSEPDPDSVPGRIVAMRLARGWRQEDLAARCVPPMHKSAVSHAEAPGANVSAEKVGRLAAALGCEPGELRGGPVDGSPPPA